MTYATVCSGIECMSVACRGLPLRPVFFSEIEPFPCAVLKAHYPDVPNLGDMSKIQVSSGGLHITNGKENITLDKPLDILAGGTPCFAAGTMVLTPNGYVPIETLKVGDEVVTHRGRLRKILRVGSKIAETAEARIVSRPPMRCTLDHKFWSATKTHHNHDNHLVIDGCGFLEVEKNISGYVAQQRAYDIPMPDNFPVSGVTSVETVIELAGWYCGDGCIRLYKDRKNRVVVLCVNADKMAVLLERLGEKIHICQGNPDANGVFKAQICSTSLAMWLERHFGKLAHCKTVPAWLIAAPQNVRDAFIRGYLATDGCTLPNGTVSFTTVSKSLAYGVADILRDACVFYNDVPSRCVIQGREVNQRPFYIVRKNLHANRFHKHGDWAFVRVKSLANRRTEKVYQIEVEEDHSYVSNGIVSKNCQDVSVAGKRAGMQEGSGTRSSLAFDFVRLARELRPRWVLWENVAGSIDSKNAPDFLRFVGALGDCGYTIAWRVLDAQYVRVDGMERAVPQRRRRVWVVGCLGADESIPAQILFEPDCVAGHTAPRRRAGQGFAYSLAGRDRVDAQMVGEPAARGFRSGSFRQFVNDETCGTLDCKHMNSAANGTPAFAVHDAIALDGDKLKPRVGQRKGGNGLGVNEDGAGYTLTGVDRHGVAYGIGNGQSRAAANADEELSKTLDCMHDHQAVCYENHGQDSRIKPIEVSDTRNQKDGTGGNNLPLVCFSKVSHPKAKDGDGERWDKREVAQTRNTLTLELARQTGRVYDPSGAITSLQAGGGVSGMRRESVLMADNLAAMRYIVRRITPTEAERLMGLPDGYTIPVGLDPNDPALVAEFQRIFDTFGAIMAEYEHAKPPKPKTAAQVQKWLEKITNPDTCPDSPRYKACGNGWATNQPRWILTRLLAIGEGIDPYTGETL